MILAKILDFFFDIFLPKKTPKSVRQFLSYLVCGGFASLADMFVLFTLTKIFAVNHLIAAAFGFFVGVATNYTLNTILVFESKGKKKTEFTLFAIIGVGGLLWTEFLLWIFVDNLQINLMIAKMIAIILVLNWNFFMRKKFVFPAESNIKTLEKSIEEL